ncbi:MAG: hypothetical protein V3V04_06065 [Rhizobiaceae bacterium]
MQGSKQTTVESQSKAMHPHGRSLSDLWLNGVAGVLYPAEWKLLKCAARGKRCVFNSPRPSHPTNENRIRAELLRFIALGGDDQNPLHEHGIWLQGAFIDCADGELDFWGTTIPYTLLLTHCHIDGELFLLDACAKTIALNGSYVHGIKADGLRAEESIFLSEGFTSTKEVRFIGASIGGDLTCQGGIFLCEKSCLSINRASIHGSCFLDKGFLAKGTVNLSNATISGNLNCQGGTFSSKGQAIHAPRLTVGDNVNLGKECRVAGQVSFQAANIGGDITFAHGSFEGKPAVNMRNAKIQGMLVWRDIDHARGELNLSGASCRTLNMDWKSWERPDQVRIDNFTYQGFSELPSGCDADFWREWLERQPKRHLEERYRPKPYSQLASVLHTMGHEEEARAIRIEQRKRQSLFTQKFEAVANTSEAKVLRKLIVLWNFIQWAVVSYGYRPGKAVFYLFGMICIGSVIYHAAARDGIMTPTHPLIFKETVGGFIPKQCAKNWVYPAAEIKARCEAAVPSEYSTFNAIIYSIDTAIPVVNFRMEADWSPRVVTWDGGKSYSLGWWVRTWEWVQIALGWGLSLLFVSAIGGVIRRD